MNPLISVVMPVYNGEKFLREAIDSILNQTYTNFEFIILNDGSTDKTENIINSYSDQRIVYIKNEKNLQIVKTLNKGIELAKGTYIARMDADDISLPKRFETQIQFMENKPEIGVCGTWIEIFGSRQERWKYPVEHNEIKAALLFNSPFAHPSVMIKKLVFKNNKYDEECNKAEDYKLWLDIENDIKFHNIPEYLLRYRLHEKQTNKNTQFDVTNEIRYKVLNKIGCSFSDKQLKNYINIASYNFVEIKDIESVFYEILISNKKSKYLDLSSLEDFLGKKFFININLCRKYSIEIFYAYYMSPLKNYIKVEKVRHIKLWIKYLIGYLRNIKIKKPV